MANKLLGLPSNRLFTNSNLIAPGGTAQLYLSGGLTPANFLDSNGTSLGPTLTANGLGQLPDSYQDENTAFRLILKDKLGVELDGGDIDPFFFGRDSSVITTAAGSSVSTRALLAAISSPVSKQSAALTESGHEGLFIFSTANLSTNVTADPQQGVYVAPSSDTTGASGAWVRVLNGTVLTPKHFGAAGDGTTDDTTALQAFWTYVIANSAAHDCSGVYAISSTLTIGPASVPITVPSQPLYGRMRVVALNAMNEMVRLKNLTYRRWLGGLYCVGIGSASFASRTCLIGTYFENCSRLEVSHGIFGDNFALANAYCGTANNNMMRLGGIHGSNIGSGQVGNSLTANWSTPVNSGSSGSTSQRTTIAISAFPSAAIQGYEAIGTFPVQVRIAGYLYYVYSVDQVAGTATIFPWLDNTSFATGSGSCEWVFGGNFCTRSTDANLIEVERLDASSVGRNLSEGVSYGSIIRDMQTNGAGTEICLGSSPSNAAAGTLILGRYNEGGAASSEQIVHVGRFGASNYHLLLGDSGAPDLSKCWALGDPRATAGNIVGGELGAAPSVGGGITFGYKGRLLSRIKNSLGRGLGSTLGADGQAQPPIPVIYVRDSHNISLSVQGAGEYNRLFGYSGGIVGYIGTGTNGAPTGSFVFTPPTGGTVNGGAVNATATFSGFDGPVLFSYEHTDTAQLTWLVRPLTGQSRSNLSALGYATGAGGAITQATSKATGVTLSKLSGQITMNAAALAAAGVVSFVVTNTLVAATDTINLNLQSGNATAGTYRYWIDKVSAGSFVIAVENRSAGSLSEALVLNFAVLKAVAA